MSDVLVTWWGVLQAISHRFLQFQNEWCVSDMMRCVAGYFSQISTVSEWVMCQWGDEVVCCRLFLTDPSSFRMSDVLVRWYDGVLQAISHRSQQFQNEWCVSEVMWWCVAGYFSQISTVSEWMMCWWGDVVVCCRLFLTDPGHGSHTCQSSGTFSSISPFSLVFLLFLPVSQVFLSLSLPLPLLSRICLAKLSFFLPQSLLLKCVKLKEKDSLCAFLCECLCNLFVCVSAEKVRIAEKWLWEKEWVVCVFFRVSLTWWYR